MKRHDLRKRSMKYIYKHLLLKKPIFMLIQEEGKIMRPEGSTYILDILRDIEENEEKFIQEINSHLKNWSFERLSYVEQAILLVALSEFELQKDDKAVIIDEAIKLTKTYSDEESFSYINAVLDAYEPTRNS